jgi:tetratricopeptide (TPR) repeat protein
MQRKYPVVVFGVYIALSVFLNASEFLVGVAWAQEGDNAKKSGIAVGYEDWGKKYRDVREAAEKLRENDHTAALQQLDKAVGKYPELPPSELIAAEWYVANNRIERAFNALDTAAQKYPDDPETYLLLGNLAFLQNRNTEAALAFQKADELLESFSGDSLRSKRLQLRLNAGLASLAERFGEWENAIQYLQKWVELDPSNASARVRYARTLFRNKKGREAYQQLRRAKNLDKAIMSAAMHIAQFNIEEGNMELAQQWLESASRKNTDDFKPRVELANFFWNNGQFIKAKDYVQQARALNKGDIRLNILAGQVAHYDHDYDTAIALFEEIFNAQPDNQIGRNHLILALAAEGSEDNVQRALQLAESGGSDIPSLVNQCYALARSGNKEKSRAMMQAADGGTTGPNANYIFAYVLAEDGKLDQALPLLEAALKDKKLFVFRRNAQKLREKAVAERTSKG